MPDGHIDRDGEDMSSRHNLFLSDSKVRRSLETGNQRVRLSTRWLGSDVSSFLFSFDFKGKRVEEIQIPNKE